MKLVELGGDVVHVSLSFVCKVYPAFAAALSGVGNGAGLMGFDSHSSGTRGRERVYPLPKTTWNAPPPDLSLSYGKAHIDLEKTKKGKSVAANKAAFKVSWRTCAPSPHRICFQMEHYTQPTFVRAKETRQSSENIKKA